MNRSQEHGLVCGKRRERFKTLSFRTALYLTLNEQINTISNTLGLHAQRPEVYIFSPWSSLLKPFLDLCTGHCFSSRACCGEFSLLLLGPNQEDNSQESEHLFPQVQKSAADCWSLQPGVSVWVAGWKPLSLPAMEFSIKIQHLGPQNTEDKPASTHIFSHPVICSLSPNGDFILRA